MTGMIEKVARALCVADGYMPEECDVEVGHTPAPLWHDYINRARAAIEAMREPTEGMLDDADEPFHDEWKRQRESNVKAGRDKNAGFGSGPFSRRIWQAMIAEALEGEG